MPLTCGWRKGSHQEDGFCGEPASVAYLVEVRDVPLINPDAEAHTAALMLCLRHDPANMRVRFPGVQA